MLTNEEKQRFLKARRECIESCFGNLNDMQKKAVMATEGPLLLLAGAGSGKTTVLVNRVSNLIRFGKASDSDEIPEYIEPRHLALLEEYNRTKDEELKERAFDCCQLDPAAGWQVIAITFTNKAANEMKERLERIVPDSARDIWASTFHSACCRMLRRDADRIGYGTDFTIYDTNDTDKLIKSILKDLNLDDKTFPPRSVLSEISKAKDAGLSPEEYDKRANTSGDYRRIRIARCYMLYQDQLKKNNAMDFDDILTNTVKLLSECEDVRSYYQRKFRYVLIDEYQDTNRTQYLFASLIAGGYKNFCVVGDDDQSIYRFRGATVENILQFEEQYPGCRVIKLEQNYRSTANILEAANAVIRNNSERKDKHLWTAGEKGDKLTVLTSESEREEAERIAARMIEIKSTYGGKWTDFAVLYRMNAQSNAIEYAFKRNGIPYKVVGGMRFFDRAEVKDMLSYLCLIHNPSDSLRLMRVVNNPPRGIGDRSLEKAQNLAAALTVPLIDILRDAWKYPELKSAAPKMMAFAQMIDECIQLEGQMTVTQLYDHLMENCGYLTALEAKDTAENRARAENIRELKSTIVNYEISAESPTLAGYLEETALYTDLDSYDESEEKAVLMTIHSAKGLEFENVFIAGMEDGIFPGKRAIGEEDELQEERRLCYVAITRAKKRLYFSVAKRRMLFGMTTANRPSMFLREIPEEYLFGLAPKKKEWSFEDEAPHREAAPRTAGVSARRGAPVNNKPINNTYKPSVPKSDDPVGMSFCKGDTVNHKAFGKGFITAITPMGGDFLIEVAFDKVGTKRLMYNTASRFMSKG